MSEHPQIEEWLDLWETEAEQADSPSLDRFITRTCRNGNPQLVRRFREIVGRLRRIDHLIQRFAVDDSAD